MTPPNYQVWAGGAKPILGSASSRLKRHKYGIFCWQHWLGKRPLGGRMTRYWRRAAPPVLAGALLLVACLDGGSAAAQGLLNLIQPSRTRSNGQSLQWSGPVKRVLLVTPSVNLTELTMGGVQQARADWSDAAQKFLLQDASEIFHTKGLELAVMANLENAHDFQLARLHDIVGDTIVRYAFARNREDRLANKDSALDWTLGPGTNDMRTRYGADYALFVRIDDSYSSDGRAAVNVLLLGKTAGRQIGYASLVDLRTGNIVWFNLLQSRFGDLRTEAPARQAVTDLLGDIPL